MTRLLLKAAAITGLLSNDLPSLGGTRPSRVHGSFLVLTALILVCSLAVTPDLAACSRSNAVHTMFVPEQFGNPVTCVMHGQAYLAETSIGQEIGQDERVKIVCVRNASAARTVGSLR